MGNDVLDIQEIDRTQVAVAGGKGALLGELMQIEGVRVPPGFCITTAAFRRTWSGTVDPCTTRSPLPREARGPRRRGRAQRRASRKDRGDRPSRRPDGSSRGRVGPVWRGPRLRGPLQRHRGGLADGMLCRSARRLPERHWSQGILREVRQYWPSLFSERAMTYRFRGAIGIGTSQMAVIVRRMVLPVASGILFAADAH